MKLNNLNLVELNAQEMLSVEGGSIPKWVKTLGWGWLATSIIDNWNEIKEGAADGWNAIPSN